MLTNKLHGGESPWETNRSSACQQIPPILWNPKIHCPAHNSPSLVPILKQTNPVHTVPFSPFRFHFNFIIPSTPRTCKWSLSSRFSNQNRVSISVLSIHATLFTHLTHLYLISLTTRTIAREVQVGVMHPL